MTKPRYGEQANTIRNLCARPEGCSLNDAAKAINREINSASVYLACMMRHGEVTKAGRKRQFRYFKDVELAALYDIKCENDLKPHLEMIRINRLARRAEIERAKREETKAARMAAKKLKDAAKAEEKLRLKMIHDAKIAAIKTENAAQPEKPKKVKVVKKPVLVKKQHNIVIETHQQFLDQKREHKQAKIIWPSDVKVQVLETRQDTRYAADKGYVGSFTREWQERRAA